MSGPDDAFRKVPPPGGGEAPYGPPAGWGQHSEPSPAEQAGPNVYETPAGHGPPPAGVPAGHGPPPAGVPAGYGPPPGYGPPAAAPAGYGVPPGYGPPDTSSRAIVALVLAVGSFCVFPLVPAIAALLVARGARREIAASRGRLTGAGLLTGAVVTAWLNIALCTLVILGVGVLVAVALRT